MFWRARSPGVITTTLQVQKVHPSISPRATSPQTWQRFLLDLFTLAASSRQDHKLAVRGLARYGLHTTATWDQFWNIIKKVWNYSDWVFLVSPWLIESRSYKKIKAGTSHILHHTSHITYCIGICMSYKIVVIKTIVPFNNLFKLILKKVEKSFFYENFLIFNISKCQKKQVLNITHHVSHITHHILHRNL